MVRCVIVRCLMDRCPLTLMYSGAGKTVVFARIERTRQTISERTGGRAAKRGNWTRPHVNHVKLLFTINLDHFFPPYDIGVEVE